jgi:sulfite reductase alpha subunit-like flavoprotein
MGSSVRQTILQIIKEEGNLSEDESIGYLNNLSNNGRYKTDLFA